MKLSGKITKISMKKHNIQQFFHSNLYSITFKRISIYIYQTTFYNITKDFKIEQL